MLIIKNTQHFKKIKKNPNGYTMKYIPDLPEHMEECLSVEQGLCKHGTSGTSFTFFLGVLDSYTRFGTGRLFQLFDTMGKDLKDLLYGSLYINGIGLYDMSRSEYDAGHHQIFRKVKTDKKPKIYDQDLSRLKWYFLDRGYVKAKAIFHVTN